MERIARNLVTIEIDKEMSASYLDYSMSVIIGRALPDVRDGLKPVHRRILYAMWKEGLLSNRRFSKCAGVVGEVLKKYHPHGDNAVYDALVRLAQPWNLRYLLVDGQGNFGSVDGDNAAAYRYTECRMMRLAESLLADIDKETVNFGPNFDGATEEPEVLPAAFPNLLVNGAEGIAVGMATKIPPHNLGEIIDGLLALSLDPEISISALMEYIPGPDFPTAGRIYGMEGVRDAYHTGRGRLVVRGKVHFEEVDGREAIILDELPYQVNKARLCEEIDELSKSKKIEGIHTVRDESDRQGMRVVIELKRDIVREVVLNNLFRHSQLQNTFGVIMLAIVNQRPHVLNLKEMLACYLGHRREVVLRRTRFELRKARERAHILEGYRIALDHIDAVIATIRASATTDQARDALEANFGLTVIQAQAILEMRLARLTGLERDKIEEEYREIQIRIAELLEILGSDTRLLEVIRAELSEIKQQFGDQRRTEIVAQTSDLSRHDLVAEEDQVVTLSHRGYIKRTAVTEYRSQRRGGQGRSAMGTRDADFVSRIFIANTHDVLMVFTNRGLLYQVQVMDVPESSPGARGKPIANLAQIGPEESVAAVVSVRDFDSDLDLLFMSRRGLVKRTELSAYGRARSNGLIACDVADGDALLDVVLAERSSELLINTRQGMSIRFPGDEIRPLGRVARGVRGIDVDDDDEVVSIAVLPPETGPAGEPRPEGLFLLTATTLGYGKRTVLEEYTLQHRNGKGLIDIRTGERNGAVVGALVVAEDDQVMIITDSGRIIRTRVSEIRSVGRNTMGVRLMRLDDNERIVGLVRVEDTQEADAAQEGESAGPDDNGGDAVEGALEEALDAGDAGTTPEGEG